MCKRLFALLTLAFALAFFLSFFFGLQYAVAILVHFLETGLGLGFIEFDTLLFSHFFLLGHELFLRNFLALALALVLTAPVLFGPAETEAAETTGAGDVSLNFVDVDITTVTKSISEITGKNFIFDDRLRGKVTIIAPEGLGPEGAFNLFTSVLQLKGLAAVPAGPGTYKIVKSARAKQYGIDPAVFKEQDLHVHVPAGAVPKDGPSAGITMTTALVSLLSGRHVKPTVGMTGEITLQGQVLPIGGVKQKVLAAHRSGLTEVVLPKRNEPDLDDVPDRVSAEMTFHLAETYDDVAAVAFS